MNDKGTKFPPLPASDSESLERNSYDSFWKTRVRDFWGENQISSYELQPFIQCEHYFIPTTNGAECNKCHIGYLGPFYGISGGKLIISKPLKT